MREKSENDLQKVPQKAGSAYLVRPAAQSGPGVLVLHSWWGLNRDVKAFAEALADHGFVALVPDLLDGFHSDDPVAAQTALAERDPNEMAALILSSVATLRAASDNISARIGVVGFSMGASWVLWLAARQPDSVAAAVAYYGTQSIDFDEAKAAIMVHLAENDTLVEAEDAAFMEATFGLAGVEYEVYHYTDTHHWFAEPSHEHFDSTAAELANQRTIDFLTAHLFNGR